MKQILLKFWLILTLKTQTNSGQLLTKMWQDPWEMRSCESNDLENMCFPKQIFKYVWIVKILQTNIWIYSVVQKATNEYPNIFVLGKLHEYKYEQYWRVILFEYLNNRAHYCSRPGTDWLEDVAIFGIEPPLSVAATLIQISITEYWQASNYHQTRPITQLQVSLDNKQTLFDFISKFVLKNPAYG